MSQTTMARLKGNREFSPPLAATGEVMPSRRVPPKEEGRLFSQCAILPITQAYNGPQVRNVSTNGNRRAATFSLTKFRSYALDASRAFVASTMGAGTG